eukprot:m.112500 g.112500  ORF g.112500 m.112500 type:complete len:122 (-) comp13477_c0_seq2:2-367(-)
MAMVLLLMAAVLFWTGLLEGQFGKYSTEANAYRSQLEQKYKVSGRLERQSMHGGRLLTDKQRNTVKNVLWTYPRNAPGSYGMAMVYTGLALSCSNIAHCESNCCKGGCSCDCESKDFSADE